MRISDWSSDVCSSDLGAAYVCNNGGFEWIEAGGLLFPGHAANAEACGSIQRVDLTTGAVTTLYDSFEGERLKGPNDIVFDADGGFWFTDHGQVRDTGRAHAPIYYRSEERRVGNACVSTCSSRLSP